MPMSRQLQLAAADAVHVEQVIDQAHQLTRLPVDDVPRACQRLHLRQPFNLLGTAAQRFLRFFARGDVDCRDAEVRHPA